MFSKFRKPAAVSRAHEQALKRGLTSNYRNNTLAEKQVMQKR
jgi:hypothetical protein